MMSGGVFYWLLSSGWCSDRLHRVSACVMMSVISLRLDSSPSMVILWVSLLNRGMSQGEFSMTTRWSSLYSPHTGVTVTGMMELRELPLSLMLVSSMKPIE